VPKKWRASIAGAAANLCAARREIYHCERRLQRAVAGYIDANNGLRDLARKLDCSAAYLSDIRRGNRKVSAAFLARLGIR
jgi:transcriptional regulator with XRE-family HTH domain